MAGKIVGTRAGVRCPYCGVEILLGDAIWLDNDDGAETVLECRRCAKLYEVECCVATSWVVRKLDTEYKDVTYGQGFLNIYDSGKD